MRTAKDALLSVQKYIDQVLNPVPLRMIAYSTASPFVDLRWTGGRYTAKDQVLVDDQTWAWLMRRPAFQYPLPGNTAFTSDGLPMVFWELGQNPYPQAVIDGIPLPPMTDPKAAASPPGPEGWEVRIAQERGEYIEGKPVALVYRVGAPTSVGSSLYADWTQPMAVHCYPVPADTIDESVLRALDVEEALQFAFRMQGVGFGRPLRVPLYDFDGVLDLTTGDSDARYGSDFLRIDGFSTEQLPDAQDPRRIRVLANFNARWRRTGRLPYGTQLVRDVTSTVTEAS